MKLKLFIIFALIIMVGTVVYFKNEHRVNCSGVIEKINLTDKTIYIKDVPEYEYLVPRNFILNNSTVIYKQVNNGELVKVTFENLKIGQKISISFDLFDDEVYKIIIKHS